MMIGIDDNQNLVYEGRTTWGHALWPTPLLVPAEVTTSTAATLKPTAIQNLGPNLLLFREDAYDPVSRVRRGRFYRAGNSQPQPWQVYPHPAMPDEAGKTNSAGVLSKSLHTFFGNPFSNELRQFAGQQVLIVLGAQDSFTVWTIVGIESTATREELVTLKARQTFGALPQINLDAIPESGREKVRAVLDKLTEDIYRAGPESVVDGAREVATAALSTYMQDRELVGPGLELGDLLKKLRGADEQHLRRIAVSAGEIVQRFHSRRKNAEQEVRQFRPIRQQDAELAVQCVGTILCELGWADWV